ncbi:MAG: HAD family hydrolase [Pseudonocardiaceae bacterium]
MLPEHLRAVCFDIGGVLVRVPRGFLAEELADTLGADPDRVRQLLIEYGKRRRSSSRILARALATGCGQPVDVDRVEAILRQRHRDIADPVLYPDAIPTMETLRAAGWRICFLSNAISDTADRPRPAWFSFAEVVVHSWEIGYCKPEIQAFRAIEQRMGLAAREIVSVGDSLRSDVLGALDASWSAVHLPRTGRPPPPPHVVPTISSLPELLTILPPVRGGSVHAGAINDAAR